MNVIFFQTQLDTDSAWEVSESCTLQKQEFVLNSFLL